jgi:hypothetical protein
MRSSELQLAWEQRIKQEFNALRAERKYMVEYIIGKIAKDHYREYRCIESIIYGEADRRREKRNAVMHQRMGGELFSM